MRGLAPATVVCGPLMNDLCLRNQDEIKSGNLCATAWCSRSTGGGMCERGEMEERFGRVFLNPNLFQG